MLVAENQYLPCVNWMKTSINEKYIKIFEYEPFEKRTFKNRCVVAGSNGLVNLSIPLANGRNQKGVMKDIRLANDADWQKQHWRTLVSCYSKSPFWEYYGDMLAPLFERKVAFLFDWNITLIEKLCRWMDKSVQIEVSRDPWNKNEEFVIGEDCQPRNFQDIESHVRYHQLFEDRIGFQPNISCLDLLCMEGPEARFLF